MERRCALPKTRLKEMSRLGDVGSPNDELGFVGEGGWERGQLC